MSTRKAIFTPIFDECLTEFFPDRVTEIRIEIQDYVNGKIGKPKPRECGLHRSRIKFLLPKNNIIIMYWDYGAVWEFFGILEDDNKIHLQLFKDKLLEYNMNHKK